MSKKNVMYIVFSITIVIYICFQIKIYADESIDQPVKNLIEIDIKQPDGMSKNKMIEIIKACATENNTYIIFRCVDYENGIVFYDTRLNNGERYSSNPKNDDKQIVGFFFDDMEVSIRSIDELRDRDIAYISGAYYVEKRFINKIVSKLKEMMVDADVCEKTESKPIDETYAVIMISSLILCVLALILYVFSRLKEFTIRKSVGFDSIRIAIEEVKKNLIFLLGVGIIIVASFAILSCIFGMKSAVDFMIPRIIKISSFCIMFLILLLFMTFMESVRCDAQTIKGKCIGGNIIYIVFLVKTCIVLAFMFLISGTIRDITIAVKEYRITMDNVEYIKQYAMIEMHIVEESERVKEKKADNYLEFYHLLEDHYGLVIAHMHLIDYKKSEDIMGRYKRADINKNYIDNADTIFSPDGTRISSSMLEEGKINILVPENYENYDRISSSLIDCNKTACEINYIEYSDDSLFFTYFNDTELDNNGYSSNIILEVFDPDLIMKYCPRFIAADDIQAAFTWGAFYKIGSDSSKKPIDQIYPLIKESGVSKEEFTAIRADEQYYEILYYIRRQLISDVIHIILLFIALLFLCSEMTLLYYKDNSKKILVKILHGFRYKEICKEIYVLSYIVALLMFIEVVILKDVYGIKWIYSMISGIVCFFVDSIIFYVSMRKCCGKNIRLIDKEG